MNLTRLILLLAISGLLLGCASDVADNPPPPEQVPTNDDGHGWGTNVQSMSGKH